MLAPRRIPSNGLFNLSSRFAYGQQVDPEAYVSAAPKAELHVHLEGSILPTTLLDLARHNHVELPATSVEELREWFRFRDFAHFIEVYGVISRCLRTTEDYENIAYEFGAEMARQNIRYAEVTFSPSFHHHHGIAEEVWFGGLERGRARAELEFALEWRWVFDIIRSVKDPALRSRYADYTVSVAVDGISHGVVALGLGGGEAGFPPEQFATAFQRGRAGGLRSAPHAGEMAGPESVWGALKALQPDRIGHGVRSIEDPSLVKHLAARAMPLEICPTSNVRLGVYARLADHPLRRLQAHAVPFTINSDDPALFGTDLTKELALLTTEFGLDLDAIDEILLNGVRHSFLPADRRIELEARFRSELRRLREPVG